VAATPAPEAAAVALTFREEGIRDFSKEGAIDLRRLAAAAAAEVGEIFVTLISGLSGSLEDEDERKASLSVTIEDEDEEPKEAEERSDEIRGVCGPAVAVLCVVGDVLVLEDEGAVE
jgi:hypothetical protein